jgi:hypothetical protein
MADEKKTPASAKKTKPAAEAKPAAKPAAKPEAKSEAKVDAKPVAKAAKPVAKAAQTEKSGDKAAKGKATPPVTDGPSCRVEGCRQPVRAKGYCRKHYIGWRRAEVGEHHRYKICSKEGCRKPRTRGGLCDEHAGTTAPAAGAPAPEAAPAA